MLMLVIVTTTAETAPSVVAKNVSGWNLVWADEFNGPTIDSSKWSFDLGGKGWGNNELQTYTARTANVDLADGSLVIKVLKETYTGGDSITRNYTSARLLTRNKF